MAQKYKNPYKGFCETSIAGAHKTIIVNSVLIPQPYNC